MKLSPNVPENMTHLANKSLIYIGILLLLCHFQRFVSSVSDITGCSSGPCMSHPLNSALARPVTSRICLQSISRFCKCGCCWVTAAGWSCSLLWSLSRMFHAILFIAAPRTNVPFSSFIISVLLNVILLSSHTFVWYSCSLLCPYSGRLTQKMKF